MGEAMRRFAVLACFTLLGACNSQTVRQEDLDAWAGRPVADLDVHPVFVTMAMRGTTTPDGTEIRNYVNSREATSCFGGGSVTPGYKPAGYSAISAGSNSSQSMMCSSSTPTCNNLFYIKGGKVEHYTPVGSGGARCFTNEKLQPGYNGPVDY
jgi:hypothetical protein